ncbi:MAG TPA: hypothetical protein VM933_11125 [Acidimicrobiales bacterium]|nr:hypothetical protein [Acidimicrobiales bacterium]
MTTIRDEVLGMSDLSNLLGDVYGDHSPDAAPVRREAPADQRGTEDPTVARSAEHAPPSGSVVDAVPLPSLSHMLPEAPSAPSAAWTSTPAPAPAPVPVATFDPAPAAGRSWMPGDDDIFPMANSSKSAKR